MKSMYTKDYPRKSRINNNFAISPERDRQDNPNHSFGSVSANQRKKKLKHKKKFKQRGFAPPKRKKTQHNKSIIGFYHDTSLPITN